MTTREHGGRVNEVTWSKVQATPATIAETQAYALRQLDARAEKLERETRIGDLAGAAKDAESKAQERLAVLARSFQLQDAIAVIELDRVLDAAPEDLDGHRLGLRQPGDRLEFIWSRDAVGRFQGQHEGAAAPGPCIRASAPLRRLVHGPSTRPSRRGGPRAGDGSRRRRCRQAPRQRDLRSGQIGEGPAHPAHRRATARAAGGTTRSATRKTDWERRPSDTSGVHGRHAVGGGSARGRCCRHGARACRALHPV